MSDPVGSFIEALRGELKGREVVVTAHSNADLDAVASGLLLCEAIRALGGRCCIALDEVSKESRGLLDLLGLHLPSCGDLSPNESLLVAVVDSSTRAQVSGILDKLGNPPLVLVDHHEVGDLQEVAVLKLVDKASPSCVELVVDLIVRIGVEIPAQLATLAAAAIASETSMFSRANYRTFSAMAFLLSRGADYQWIISRLQQSTEEPLDVRMARVKGASRAVVAKACDDLVIAVTEVGSYEAEVARGLVALGADVVIVIKGDRASVRLSRRSASRGLSAGGLSEAIAKVLGGEGGGHRGAAGFKLPAEPSDLDRLKQRVAGITMNYVNRICGGGGGGI